MRAKKSAKEGKKSRKSAKAMKKARDKLESLAIIISNQESQKTTMKSCLKCRMMRKIKMKLAWMFPYHHQLILESRMVRPAAFLRRQRRLLQIISVAAKK